MIVLVAGEIDFPPENRAAALLGARDLIDMSRAEKGCSRYEFTASPSDPGRVHVFEEWECADDFAAHLTGPAYTGMLAHLSQHAILAANARKYRCDVSEPVYGPDGVATATFHEASASRG